MQHCLVLNGSPGTQLEPLACVRTGDLIRTEYTEPRLFKEDGSSIQSSCWRASFQINSLHAFLEYAWYVVSSCQPLFFSFVDAIPDTST